MRKVHYKPEDKAFAVHNPSGDRETFSVTSNPDEVTCSICKSNIAKQERRYKCPLCGALTITMRVTESVIQRSIIPASNKYLRKGGLYHQRELISVECPACDGKIPTNGEDWRELSDKLITKNDL
jgi:Zn finger protein HypA/HybF involved in hydrogenase expression